MLHVENLGYEIDGHLIFKDVEFSINKGDKIGLVGHNGAGKTTLLNIIAGQIQPTEGKITKDDYEVGLLPQDLTAWLDHSTYRFIEEVTGVAAVRAEFDKSCQLLEAGEIDHTLTSYENALDKYNRYHVANFDTTLEKALARAGIKDINVHESLGNFSGGQKTRIAMAALFAAKYDVILLDEPTNNLDNHGTVALEKYISRSNAAFMMVSHDRRFLRNATSRIIELMGDGKGVTQYGLGYDEYITSRRVANEAASKRYDQYEAERRRLNKAAKDANARSASAAGKHAKADNDKLAANFRQEKAAAGLSRQAQSITSRLDQLEEPDRLEAEHDLNFSLKEAGKKRFTLLTANEITVKYDGSDKVFGPLSLHIQNGDKLAISGDNGVGKTSLLKALAGELPLHSGSYRLGKEAIVVYMDQQQSVPLRDNSAVENLRLLAPQLELHEAIHLLVRFNITKEVMSSVPAEKLSGGERAKILLAAIVANQANLIILDEPTNNLDIPTIEALESALTSYQGSAIVVSHDRDFLDNLGVDHEILLTQ